MQLYENARILTVDRRRTVYPDGAVAVEAGRIADVGPAARLRKAYPGAQRVDCRGGILLPGLINTHIHLAQCLARGMADELPLFPDWLQGRIWPLQASYSPEEFLVSARVGLCEMLKTGTTTFVETMLAQHYGLDGLVEEVERSGMRGMLSKIVMDDTIPNALPKGMTESRDASLASAIDYYKKYHGAAGGRIGIWLGPRWTGLFDPHLLFDLAQVMGEYGMHTDIHYAETAEDVQAIFDATGMTPAQYLQKTGLAGKNTVAIHGTAFPREDYRILAETGTSVAHCPVANMAIALGYCDAPGMLAQGVNVSLGTDAMACNNNADIFLEMRGASLLHRHTKGDTRALPAWDILEMATIRGARALGLEEEIGSLEVGKRADFILVDTDKIKFAPDLNPVSSVVYSANGADVSLVVVDGRVLCRGGALLTLDEERCMAKAKELGRKKAEQLSLKL